jgi:hypothetical protein
LSILLTIESLSVIVGVILVVFQINLQVQSTRKDHDRKKRQTTFEFYFLHLKEEDTLWKDIEEIVTATKNCETTTTGKCKLDFEIVNANLKWKKTVEQYLTHLELLALGVASETYDFETFYLIASDFLIGIYEQLEDYIIKVRKEEKTDTTYAEFEYLIKRVKQHKKDNSVKILGEKYLMPKNKILGTKRIVQKE